MSLEVVGLAIIFTLSAGCYIARTFFKDNEGIRKVTDGIYVLLLVVALLLIVVVFGKDAWADTRCLNDTRVVCVTLGNSEEPSICETELTTLKMWKVLIEEKIEEGYFSITRDARREFNQRLRDYVSTGCLLSKELHLYAVPEDVKPVKELL